MTKLADVIQRGTNAARPAATTVPVGTLYYDTTNSSLGRSNGTTWDSVEGGGGSGTFTTVKDEGSNLSTAVVSMDFVGAGVTATGTTAVTVTIPGGGDVVRLADSVLGSDTASFDFTSISGSYKHLRLELALRSDRAASTQDTVSLKVNNDTGANYDYVQGAFGTGSSFPGYLGEAVGQTIAQVGQTPAASSVAGAVAVMTIMFYDYASTTLHKHWSITGFDLVTNSANNLRIIHGGGRWAATTAISRLTIAPVNGSNWKTGSRATLYGLG